MDEGSEVIGEACDNDPLASPRSWLTPATQRRSRSDAARAYALADVTRWLSSDARPVKLPPGLTTPRHPPRGRVRTQDVDAKRLVFAELDRSAPFHRDSALGRIFHPGTVSFRQIRTDDSLHITVSPENRVTVHVDRLSPLAVRPGRPCRYSLLRAVAHNVVHAAQTVVLVCRRRPAQRCELDCSVVTVQASPERVYEFSCKAAGAQGCGWSTRAATEEDLVAKVAEHVRRVHGVKTVSDTLAAYVLTVASARGGSS